MLLEVTAEDIEKARVARSVPAYYSSERDCPIGQALRRSFNTGRLNVRAHPDYISVRPEGGTIGYSEQCYRASQPIRVFMAAWDRPYGGWGAGRRKPVTPRKFRLDAY